MKKILTLILAGLAGLAHAQLAPIQLLNPAGSTSGQAIVSTGPSTAPAWGTVTVGGLTPIGANTVYGNFTGSSASPTANAVPSCSTANSALKYTTNTGLTCGTTFALTGSNTFTASQTVSYANSSMGGTGQVVLNETGGSGYATAVFMGNSVPFWHIQKTAAGNFAIGRYVAGSFTDNPISCTNAAGVCTLTQRPVFGSATPWDSANLNFAAPPAIGATTPAAGTFTTLSSTGNAKVIANTVGPQSFSSGVTTVITGWTKSLDVTTAFNASTGIFTAPVAGTYMVTVQARLIGTTWAVGNLFQIVLNKNGSVTQAGIKTMSVAGAYTVDDHLTFFVNCADSDTLSIALFHNGTGAGAIDTNANINNLGITRIP